MPFKNSSLPAAVHHTLPHVVPRSLWIKMQCHLTTRCTSQHRSKMAMLAKYPPEKAQELCILPASNLSQLLPLLSLGTLQSLRRQSALEADPIVQL